jgi:hypothetical protein
MEQAMKNSDITVTNNHNGVAHLMAMNGSHLMQRKYIGYTVKEARQLFKADAIKEKYNG